MRLKICVRSEETSRSQKKHKLALLVMAMTAGLTTAQPSTIASDGNLVSAGRTIATTDGAEKGAETTAGKNLSLDNIQDLAFTLQRIRQQAINIYVEATRKNVYRFDLNVPSLSAMPTTELEDQSAYLPLRQGWIAFFIGTMEPLVDILNQHLKSLDQRTEEAKVPASIRPEWNGIVGEWTNAIKRLNEQLDVCTELLNNKGPGGNLKVAKAAKAIDSDVSVLDTILHKASKFLQDNKIAK